MKRSFIASLVALVFAAGAGSIHAADAAGMAELLPESKLWLVGDSTLHAYASQANEKKVALVVDGPADAPVASLIKGGKMKALEVRVPVKSLKSGKGQLDKNLYRTLKSEEHPDIIFRMDTYEVLPSTAPGQFTVKAVGDLSVAGASRPVDIEAQVAEGETARITGSESVLMSDHGVKPPAFFGAIKTHDRVVVNFDLLVK